MRKGPLDKEEKQQVESLLRKLQILPPAAGQVVLNIDPEGKVSSVELARVVWR